jgi:hypothetical protein
MLSQLKEVLFWGAFLFGVPAGAVFAANSQRFRDMVFFCIVVGTVRADWLDINFLSREWYRGTTRGIEISYLDLLILILLLGLMLSAGRTGLRLSLPAGMGALLLYFAYASLNVVAHEPRVFGLFELTKIVRGMCVFVTAAWYFRGEREMRVLFAALLTAGCIQGFDAAYQRYVLHGHRVTGTLPHPNALSQYCTMVVGPLMVYAMMTPRAKSKMIYIAGVALTSGAVVLSISRMGVAAMPFVMALAIIGSLRLRFSQANLVLAILIAVAAVGGGVKASNTLMSRYGSASLEDEYGRDDAGRGLYLRLAKGMVLSHFFGVGLNNWSYWVSAHGADFNLPYVPYPDVDESTDFTGADKHIGIWTQAAPGHNLMALTVAELGWPGLILLLAMWAQWFWQSAQLWRSRVWWNWIGLAGFTLLLAVFIQNVTEYEFRLTPIFFLTLIMAGCVSSALRAARAQADMPLRQPEPELVSNA